MGRERAATVRISEGMRASVSPPAPQAPELRPLNLPVPLTVTVGADGEPAWVLWRGHRLRVLAVLDRWRIDDEWWRTPIVRLYRRLHLDGDRLLTVFEDLDGSGWYAQRYRYPASATQHTTRRRRGPHT